MPAGKILVVDDARAVVETLRKALQKLGVAPAQVVTASTPAEALQAFREHKPTLIFMDMDLGGKPGDPVAAQMLEDEPFAKVVVTTGLSPDSDRVRAVVSAGAYAVLEKPIRLTKLRDVLDLIDTEERGLRRVL